MAADDAGGVPPATLPVIAGAIPGDLRALRRFVVWNWVYRHQRWVKPPLRADGLGEAWSNDAGTWSGCAEALAAYRRRQLAGIGFAVASDDPFFFVDLDDCRDPRTGAIDPWAARILERFRHTYREVSPSASGFKILGLGTPLVDQRVKPIRSARPRAKVEIFASGKYTTLTGHRLPGAPSTVREAQAALDGLYAELFPEEEDIAPETGPRPAGDDRDDDDARLNRARNAHNGAAFGRLFDAGDRRDYGHDERRGDRALVVMLACWFGPDRARLDRVFRRSALMRDRWDERYHDADHTYGDGIIDSALAGRADVSEPTRPPPRAAHADHPLHPSRRGEAGRSSERPGPSDRA